MGIASRACSVESSSWNEAHSLARESKRGYTCEGREGKVRGGRGGDTTV